LLAENLGIGRGNVLVPLLVIRRLASIVEKSDIWQENVEVQRPNEGAEEIEIATTVIEIEIVTIVMIAPIGIATVMNVTHLEPTMTILVLLRVVMNMRIDTVVIMVMVEVVQDLHLDMAEDHLHLLVLHHVRSILVHTVQMRIAVGVEAQFVRLVIMEGHLVQLAPVVLLFVLNLALIVQGERMGNLVEVLMDDINVIGCTNNSVSPCTL